MTNLFSYPINPRWFKPWPVGGHWKTFVWRGQYWGHVNSPSRKRATFAEGPGPDLYPPSTPGRSPHAALGMPYDTAGDAIISSEIELHNLAAQMWIFDSPWNWQQKPRSTNWCLGDDPFPLGFRPKCYIVSGRVRFLFEKGEWWVSVADSRNLGRIILGKSCRLKRKRLPLYKLWWNF